MTDQDERTRHAAVAGRDGGRAAAVAAAAGGGRLRLARRPRRHRTAGRAGLVGGAQAAARRAAAAICHAPAHQRGSRRGRRRCGHGHADGDRPRSESAARRMLVDDLAVATGVQVLLLRGEDRAPPVGAAADLLRADRSTATAMLADGRLLAKSSWTAARSTRATTPSSGAGRLAQGPAGLRDRALRPRHRPRLGRPGPLRHLLRPERRPRPRRRHRRLEAVPAAIRVSPTPTATG